MFDDDVKEFEKSHPNIEIEPHEGFMDPKTFSAKLAGGQLEDVYYVYFTDPAQMIARHQAADITEAVKDVPHVNDIQPELLRQLPATRAASSTACRPMNYTMGLLYNRTLFQKAGLDPDKPPTTWDEVRADAKKISALGNGVVGYADYSKSNQGGWHFDRLELYSMGGDSRPQGRRQVGRRLRQRAGRAVLAVPARHALDRQLHGRQAAARSSPTCSSMMGAGPARHVPGRPGQRPDCWSSSSTASTRTTASPPCPAARARCSAARAT